MYTIRILIKIGELKLLFKKCVQVSKFVGTCNVAIQY